jgi:CBS domain-containing protein
MSSVPIDTERSPAVILELLYSLKVRDAMMTDIITARPDTSLREVQYLMRDHRITGVPIMDSGRLLGIISIGDIIVALDEGKMTDTAESVMNRTVVSLEDGMPLSFAVTYFDKYEYGRFPVLGKDGRLTGIITASDIVRRLLIALNVEVAKLEQRLSDSASLRDAARKDEESNDSAEPILSPTLRLSSGVTPLDFSRAGNASTKFKKALLDLGLSPVLARRAAVASYELELNQVIHSKGGRIVMSVWPDRLEIMAEDQGPGIPDIDAAMREGFSTASEWVRSLGFGAGMGLSNVRRVSDEFNLVSTVGSGTTVTSVIYRKEK